MTIIKRIAAFAAAAVFAAGIAAGAGMYHHTSPPRPVAGSGMHFHG